MKVGLIGSRSSQDLACLKREIEDRGHRATVLSPRKFPQYALAEIAWQPPTPASRQLGFDHLDLLEFACFYLHEFDLRDRFFRGEFGSDIWAALRGRYIEFAECEVENLAFQLSLALCLGEARPTINSPQAFLAARLRPSIYFRLSRMGLPVAPYELAPAGHEGAPSRRLRIGEDYYYDVPCFPRDLEGVISLQAEIPGETWRVLAAGPSCRLRLMITQNGTARGMELPNDARELGDLALKALGLEVAEVHMARYREGLKVLDVFPSPRISEFEEITGERASGAIAEKLLSLGGSK